MHHVHILPIRKVEILICIVLNTSIRSFERDLLLTMQSELRKVPSPPGMGRKYACIVGFFNYAAQDFNFADRQIWRLGTFVIRRHSSSNTSAARALARVEQRTEALAEGAKY